MDTAIWGYPDLSTCKWSLPRDVCVVNSISTNGAGLHSTHAMWHFLPEKSWNFRLQSTGERLLLLRNTAIQHSRDFMPKLNVSALWEYIKIEQVSLSCSRTVDREKWGLHRETVRSQLKPWVSRWHRESHGGTVSLTVAPWELKGLLLSSRPTYTPLPFLLHIWILRVAVRWTPVSDTWSVPRDPFLFPASNKIKGGTN